MTALPLAPSSNIASADYDEATRELTVTFHSGHSHVYRDVPHGTAVGLGHAPSPGGYFHKHIKRAFSSEPR